ncbi:MAG: MATE family efflux transporter, partial [Alphaproteobacteria bacterium]
FADAAQGILIGALRGAGDVRIPLGIQVIAYLGVAIPLGYTLGFTLDLSIQGLIVALFAGLSVAAGLLAWRFVVLVRGPIRAV